jgi:hypothetical protein
MPTRYPPDGWIDRLPNLPGTPQTWWGTYFQTDETTYEVGPRSIVMPPPPSSGGTYYLLNDPVAVRPGRRLKARARWRTDDIGGQSELVTGVAFYDSAGAYINRKERSSAGFPGTSFENPWLTLTQHANVDDYSGAKTARLFIGRKMFSGSDTNTIWVDEADLVVEPNYNELTRVTTQSIGSGGVDVDFTAVSVNAAGVYLNSGDALIEEGGTYVVHADIDLTSTNGQNAKLNLRHYDSEALTTTTFATGTEIDFATGNLTKPLEANGVRRFDAGDKVVLQLVMSSTGSTLNSARMSLVRVS